MSDLLEQLSVDVAPESRGGQLLRRWQASASAWASTSTGAAFVAAATSLSRIGMADLTDAQIVALVRAGLTMVVGPDVATRLVDGLISALDALNAGLTAAQGAFVAGVAAVARMVALAFETFGAGVLAMVDAVGLAPDSDLAGVLSLGVDLARAQRDSKILGDAMIAGGEAKPGPGWEAHHMIPVRHDAYANLRAVLARYDIDVNSAANGAWLARPGGTAQIPRGSTRLAKRTPHSSFLHECCVYRDVMQARILQAESGGLGGYAATRARLVAALDSIRSDLYNGTIRHSEPSPKPKWQAYRGVSTGGWISTARYRQLLVELQTGPSTP